MFDRRPLPDADAPRRNLDDVSRIVLVFDGDEEGDDPIEVVCERIKVAASDVRIGDFIACPFVGFVHVHGIAFAKRLAYLTDCAEREHIYNVADTLDVARPKDE